MVNRFILKIPILFATAFYLFSCGKLENPLERNRLVFTDSITSVADSINVLNAILIKTHKQYYIYAIARNYLYITDNQSSAMKVGLLSDSFLFENKAFEFMDISDRKRFIGLAAYLHRNHLSRCDIKYGLPTYAYRSDMYMGEAQEDLDRKVVLVGSINEINLRRYKILDSYDNLYLLAYKEAKIWADSAN